MRRDPSTVRAEPVEALSLLSQEKLPFDKLSANGSMSANGSVYA